MHGSLALVGEKQTRSQQVARQLRDLLDRHGLTPQDIEKRTGISYVTINRMLKAEAKTEPQPAKLKQIAAAVSEDFDEAFPEKPQIVIEVGTRKIALRDLTGRPFTEEEIEQLRALSPEIAHAIHETKKNLKKR